MTRRVLARAAPVAAAALVAACAQTPEVSDEPSPSPTPRVMRPIEGPRDGGLWYCAVSGAGKTWFHTADNRDIEPKNGRAARWLCQVIIAAAEAGLVAGY